MLARGFDLPYLISAAIALLIGMTFHEYMHNYVAWLMGDNTPAYQGRLTLDPRKHIYWPGWLMWVIVGFGILGTAPINPTLMNHPRVPWGQRLDRRQRFGVAVLSGPVGNLIIAVGVGLLFRLCVLLLPTILFATPNPILLPFLILSFALLVIPSRYFERYIPKEVEETINKVIPSLRLGLFIVILLSGLLCYVLFSGLFAPNPNLMPSLAEILFITVSFNVLLFVFNLIPLGGLDGRYILGMFIPPQSQLQYDGFQNQYGNMVLLGLILLSFINPSFNIFGMLIGGPTSALTALLTGL